MKNYNDFGMVQWYNLWFTINQWFMQITKSCKLVAIFTEKVWVKMLKWEVRWIPPPIFCKIGSCVNIKLHIFYASYKQFQISC